jgi:hypothetical protein
MRIRVLGDSHTQYFFGEENVFDESCRTVGGLDLVGGHCARTGINIACVADESHPIRRALLRHATDFPGVPLVVVLGEVDCRAFVDLRHGTEGCDVDEQAAGIARRLVELIGTLGLDPGRVALCGTIPYPPSWYVRWPAKARLERVCGAFDGALRALCVERGHRYLSLNRTAMVTTDGSRRSKLCRDDVGDIHLAMPAAHAAHVLPALQELAASWR